MRFLRKNFIETITSIAVDNTGMASFLIDGDPKTDFTSLGDDSDLTTTSITFTPTSSEALDKILLLNHNLKEFRVFYDGLTANSLSLLGAATSTSEWLNNSDTSLMLDFATLTVSSITIEGTATITPNEEKEIGEFVLTQSLVEITRQPSANGYKPLTKRKQIVHTLSDGSTKIHSIDDNETFKLKWKRIDEDNKNSLREVWDLAEKIWFAPFDTTTSWDGVASEVVWVGDFNFNQYSDNAAIGGFRGSIDLRET